MLTAMTIRVFMAAITGDAAELASHTIATMSDDSDHMAKEKEPGTTNSMFKVGYVIIGYFRRNRELIRTVHMRENELRAPHWTEMPLLKYSVEQGTRPQQ